MQITRRQFNRGAVMTSGAALMPPVPIAMKRGSEDAYEAIISELVRVEEAAHRAGIVNAGGGAVSSVGRNLEGFIGHLDMQISSLETSSQVYRELRSFVKEQAKKAVEQAEQTFKKTESGPCPEPDIPEIPSCDESETGLHDPEQPGTGATSTSPVS